MKSNGCMVWVGGDILSFNSYCIRASTTNTAYKASFRNFDFFKHLIPSSISSVFLCRSTLVGQQNRRIGQMGPRSCWRRFGTKVVSTNG
jgi:hypothetical protein